MFIIKRGKVGLYWTGKQWTRNKAKAKRYRGAAGVREVGRLQTSKYPTAFLVVE